MQQQHSYEKQGVIYDDEIVQRCFDIEIYIQAHSDDRAK